MLSETRFDICNKALVLVGANIITSFEEATTESTVAGQLYESTLEAMLTRIRWRFAAKQVQLTKLAENPLGRFQSSYQLPADALLIHTVTVNDNVIAYDRYGDKIFTDTGSGDTLICDYTFQTSENTFCSVGIFENELAIIDARPHMISNLDKTRDLLEIISTDLGVTDPVSGPSID